MHAHPDTRTEKRGSIASEDCSFTDRRGHIQPPPFIWLSEVPLEGKATAELVDLSYVDEES